MIALSGVARAGKDTFCKILIDLFAKQGIVAQRYSLADQLKKDLNPFFIEKFGIDIFSCSSQEKELIRPLMVSYGKVWREKSNGTHWTNILSNQIKQNKEKIVPIITDIRYSEFANDELQWVKNNHGILIHIKRYDIQLFDYEKADKYSFSEFPLSYQPTIKNYILPPNKEEKENDPRMQNGADILFEWKTNDNYLELKQQVKEFLNSNNKFQEWLTKNLLKI